MSFTKQQIEENNERRRVESIALSALTPDERRRHMEAKRAWKKTPVVMDEFKRLGLLTESKNDHPPRPEISHTEPECDEGPALGRAIQGEKEGFIPARVSFIGFRVRPLDPDNFAGSVKNCLDGLRHAHLIEGDEPWRVILETRQVKVATFKEERTEIIIETPDL